MRRTRAKGPATAFAPCQVDTVDLGRPPVTLSVRVGPDGSPYRRSRVLVCLHGQPLGTAIVNLDGPRSTADHRSAMDAQVGAEVALHLAADGLDGVGAGDGDRPACLPPPIQPDAAPLVSVIVCTYARCDLLTEMLSSVLASDYPNFEVLVVDNLPSDPAVRELLDATYRGDRRVRYIREHSPGLSRARNTGYLFSRGEIVAFTDDDAVAGPSWISALVAAFAADPEVSCVTGPVLAGQLDTPAQQYFEDHGGFSKGFRRRVFDLGDHRGPTALFPWAAGVFGTGANMALRKSALGDLWGFDPALGAGTAAAGGEDLDCFAELILAGHRLVYEPRAYLWHTHVRDDVALRSKLHAYGVGFSAYLTKQFVVGRGHRLALLRALPAGVGYAVRGESRHDPGGLDRQHRSLLTAELRGVVRGPWAYFRSRVRNAWLTA